MRLIIFFTDIVIFTLFILAAYGAIQAVKKVKDDKRLRGNPDNK